jgi:hypothetical protein
MIAPRRVDGGDAIEGGFGDAVERRVAAGDTHADVVMKDVDTAPAPACGLDHSCQRLLIGDVGFECDAVSARLSRHRDRFLGGGKIVVDRQHLGAFLREPQNSGAAIAQTLARRLTGADHDGDFVLKTHASLG